MPTPVRPLLYIAAPYTQPDPVVNTHRAAHVGMTLYHEGYWVPVVPHLSLLWHLVTPQPIETWYDIDLNVLARCDAIVRLPGASTGADAEVAFAIEQCIPVLEYTQLSPSAAAVLECRVKRWLLVTPYDREHSYDTLEEALIEITSWYTEGIAPRTNDLADWQLYRLTKIDLAHEMEGRS